MTIDDQTASTATTDAISYLTANEVAAKKADLRKRRS
jgi:hypothetical protein